jgi:hypothetical protein
MSDVVIAYILFKCVSEREGRGGMAMQPSKPLLLYLWCCSINLDLNDRNYKVKLFIRSGRRVYCH